MCRWFAYISDSEPCLLDDVLIRPAHSLTKQVHSSYLPYLFHHTATIAGDKAERKEIAEHNKFVNTDGTGVAFYTPAQAEYGEVEGLRPQVYRTIQPPLNDPNFISLATHNSSLCTLAHIRMSTSQVSTFNSHPFTFGRHCFIHNGLITAFAGPVRLRMTNKMSPAAFKNIMGSTDSECLAGLYFTFLGDDWEKTYPLDEMKAALEKAIQSVLDIQREVIPTAEFEPNSLNICTTDGTQLLAFRFENSKTQQPPSLYLSTTAGATLNRKFPGHPDTVSASTSSANPSSKPIHPEPTAHHGVGSNVSPFTPNQHKSTARNKSNQPKSSKKNKGKGDHGNHVIIASEPSTFDQNEWELVGKNEAVMVGTDMSVRREPIKVNF